ncbi:hypothetical protein JCM8202v2_003662 [Rhodotorula sphaerocarpa]
MPPRKKPVRGGKAAASTGKRQSSSAPAPGPASDTAAADPLQAAGVRWIVHDTPTLSLAPSHTAGISVRRVFFESREWVAPLRADVAALLALFEECYTAAQSPLELMKQLWNETGWKWVSLLGCPEGKIRLDWADSTVKAFLEYLAPEAEATPLQQVAAFLALYILRASSCPGTPLLQIKNAAPRASTEDQSPPPSADLAFVLHYFLSTSAFLPVPLEIFGVPPPADWPSVYAKRERRVERNKRLSAAVLLGVEAEVGQLSRGRIRPEVVGEGGVDARGSKRARKESPSAAQSDDEQDMSDAREVAGSWRTEALTSARRQYLEAKTGGSRLPKPQDPAAAARSLLVEPTHEDHVAILSQAAALTRHAISNLGDDAADLTALAARPGAEGAHDFLDLVSARDPPLGTGGGDDGAAMGGLHLYARLSQRSDL